MCKKHFLSLSNCLKKSWLDFQGIRLYRESDGSITATRLGKNDVIVKGHKDPANHCLSADVILNDGRLPYEQNVKVSEDCLIIYTSLNIICKAHMI